jgi:hypothetical protein
MAASFVGDVPFMSLLAAFRGFDKEAAGESFSEGTDLSVSFEDPSL